jgi:hypothetical protein
MHPSPYFESPVQKLCGLKRDKNMTMNVDCLWKRDGLGAFGGTTTDTGKKCRIYVRNCGDPVDTAVW